MAAKRLTKSSATAEIARDTDNVNYKFSEVTVHLTKKTPSNRGLPFKFNQYYASQQQSRLHTASPMCSLPTNLATPTALSL